MHIQNQRVFDFKQQSAPHLQRKLNQLIQPGQKIVAKQDYAPSKLSSAMMQSRRMKESAQANKENIEYEYHDDTPYDNALLHKLNVKQQKRVPDSSQPYELSNPFEISKEIDMQDETSNHILGLTISDEQMAVRSTKVSDRISA